MKRKHLGPVDLMMRGRMDEAAEMYLDAYPEVAGDMFIAPHLLSQLHFCVAGKEPGRAPEEATAEVEKMVLRKLRERDITMDKRIVKDDIAIAKDILASSRKRAEKALDLQSQG